ADEVVGGGTPRAVVDPVLAGRLEARIVRDQHGPTAGAREGRDTAQVQRGVGDRILGHPQPVVHTAGREGERGGGRRRVHASNASSTHRQFRVGSGATGLHFTRTDGRVKCRQGGQCRQGRRGGT